MATDVLVEKHIIKESPLTDFVAAVSVGMIDDVCCIDLDYEEDSKAQVDMNIAVTGSGEIVEIPGAAERKPFSKASLAEMYGLTHEGIMQLIEAQKRCFK